jgi:hypothetical protein
VLGLDCVLILSILVLSALVRPASDSVLAYVGPGAGLELVPYFLGLLAWAGLAIGAVVLWPLSALRRRLRRNKGEGKGQQFSDAS